MKHLITCLVWLEVFAMILGILNFAVGLFTWQLNHLVRGIGLMLLAQYALPRLILALHRL